MGFNAFSGAAGQDFSDLLRYTGERSEGRTADAQDCGAYSPEQLDAIVGPQRRWSWVEIDLSAIRNNVAVAKRRLSPGTRLMAVVKANAYGHGAVQVARTALSAGATQLAVATVSEGIQLRKAGIDAPVLVLSEPPIAAVPLLLRYNLMPSVYTSEFAVAYGEEADRHGLRAPFHLAINTGMNRIGVRFDEAVDFVRQIAFHRALEQVGTFTHFATADCAETLDFNMQLRRFKERQETPEKQWKITDEDWRNREKWDQYEVAVEEMLEKTSMPHAPWIVVEGNDKYYARIKVLECVTEAIEKRLKEERK